jgi:lipopolysaccharide/colanic/teichoic acid biosynthesis glycosyltransferase
MKGPTRKRLGKRTIDVTCAAIALLLLLPFMVMVACLVYLEDRDAVFFRQERVGLGGRTFILWKFRSMRVGAERTGPQITVGRDARITRVGRILRATKFDELPQLWNVIRSEMSLVGPRPEVPRLVALYSKEQRAVLDVVPGITDPASVHYRDESAVLARYDDPQQAYVDVVMPDKIRISLWYAERATLWSDALVMLATVGLTTPAYSRFIEPILSKGLSLRAARFSASL